MRLLLDTNVVSELRTSASRIDPSVRAWAAALRVSDLFISVITVWELERGILGLERRDERQGEILRGWLERDVLGAFDRRIVPIDLDVARRAAAMHVPDPRPERDAFIAATAQARGLVVATRNTRDFQALNVAQVNPWQP